MRTIVNKLRRKANRLFGGRQAYKFILNEIHKVPDIRLIADVMKSLPFSHRLEPTVIDKPDAKKILVIAPHPDDEMIGPGGTIIKAIQSGADVQVLCLSSGRAEEAREREREALSVAAKCGYEIRFLGQRAGAIDLGRSKKEICNLVQKFNPKALFFPSIFDDHADHRIVSEILVEGFDEGLLPKDIEAWAYQVYTLTSVNVIVDITQVAKRKFELVRLYKSQIKIRDWSHFVSGINAVQSRFLRTGPKPSFAEGFWVTPLNGYCAICAPYFGRDESHLDE